MKKQLPWILPILAFLMIAPFTPGIDLAIERYFYSKSTASFIQGSLIDFSYNWLTLPAQVVMTASACLLVLALSYKRFHVYRKPALYLVLTASIGAGLIVHGLLKDHWGRPRPKQVIEFGGEQTFRPFWEPDFHNPIESKSFVCGHCTMGFYFFTFILLGSFYKKRWLIWTGITLTAFLGIALSLTRMVQGGHFFSDILASILIMWLTSWWIFIYIYPFHFKDTHSD